MKFFEEIVARLRVLFFGSSAIPQTPTVAAPPAPPTAPAWPAAFEAQEAAELTSRNRNARPAASQAGSGTSSKAAPNAVNRAIELLAKNPQMTAAQLASALNVSQSYGRTLLRRAKIGVQESRAPEIVAPQPDLQATIRQLASRLQETESNLERLRSAPAPVPVPRPASSASRRAEVLRLNAEGHSSQAIATALAIPTGEVEFIVKIDRMSSARV